MSPTTDHDEPCPITRPYPQPFPASSREARVAPPRPCANSVTRVMAAPARAYAIDPVVTGGK